MKISKTKLYCTYLACAALSFIGCEPAQKIPPTEQLCEPAQNKQQLINQIRPDQNTLKPFRFNGNCLWRYTTANASQKQESFPVKIWADPLDNIYLQGNPIIMSRAIIAGCNENEFWFWDRIKEHRVYYHGQWLNTGTDRVDNLKISPGKILDALGFWKFDHSKLSQWKLDTKNNISNILFKTNNDGTINKKIYVDRCTDKVSQIEYFDNRGNKYLTTALENYAPVGDNQTEKTFQVPTQIKMLLTGNETAQGENSLKLEITPNSLRFFELTEQRRNIMFKRPEPENAKHIYKLNQYGRFIEQNQ
jgi:hypothetical protein